MRAAGQGCCASPSGLGVLRTPCRRSPTSLLPSAALASYLRVGSLRRALRIAPGSSASPPCRPLAAALPPSPPLRFFTLLLHLQSGVPAHYAHAPEHVYASLARTRASPLARPSPLCHAQLSLTSDLTPCSPLTRTSLSYVRCGDSVGWVGGIANSAVRLPDRRVRSSTGLTPVQTRRGGNPGFAAESLKPHFPRRCAAEPGGAHTGGLRPHKACTPVGNKAQCCIAGEKHARCRKTICPPATGLHCNLSPCDQVTRGCPAHQAWAPPPRLLQT